MQGITGIRFFGGDKCYIKSQIKANLPHMGAQNKESLMFDLVCVHYIENVQNWKILRLLSNTVNCYSSLVQGRFPPPLLLARQMKSCQWGSMRRSSYGSQWSSHWRTPAFWATKFWVFAGIFPFTGSNPSILKVTYFSFQHLCMDSFSATVSITAYSVWIMMSSFIVHPDLGCDCPAYLLTHL